jgi:hypothetical protein
MAKLSDLPSELVDRIIDVLAANLLEDEHGIKEALRNIALAHRSFTTRARAHIFSYVRLRTFEDCTELLRRGVVVPHISENVRNLSILHGALEEEHGHVSTAAFSSVLKSCSNLTTLALSYIPLRPLEQTLQLITVTSLRSLYIQKARLSDADLASIIRSLPSLTDLMLCDPIIMPSSEAVTSVLPIRLRYLGLYFTSIGHDDVAPLNFLQRVTISVELLEMSAKILSIMPAFFSTMNLSSLKYFRVFHTSTQPPPALSK